MSISRAIEIVNTPVLFEVRGDEDLLGTLQISRGGLTWFPFNSPNPRNAEWEQFAEWITT
jgi:hypothetical protein